MKYFLLLTLLFVSVAVSKEGIADVCDGMGCVSSCNEHCSLRFDSESQKIVLKKEKLLCKDKFQIQINGLLISFCRSNIDSLCTLNKNNKIFVCQNSGAQILESRFYKESDSLSKNLLFDLAMKGEFSVMKNGKSVKNVYYVEKYKLLCQEGGQAEEMIFLDKENWLLLRRNYLLWF